ncbi:MAG: ABC transporter permease subunit [Pedococcus sp.]
MTTKALRRRTRLRRDGPTPVLGAAAVLLVPLLPLLLWAFADRWSFPAILPQRWGTRGFAEVLTGETYAALGRSALVGTAVAVAATTLGVMAGRALGWKLTRWRPATVVVLLGPVALPPLAVAMGLDSLALRTGIPELVAVTLILTVFALPYTVFTMASRYAATDPAMEEQARLLGASAGQALTRVTLPALVPAIATALFLSFLVGWTDYAVTLLVGGGQLVTVPMLIGSAASAAGNEPVVAVLSLLSVLPPLLLLALARRPLRSVGPSGRRRQPTLEARSHVR